MTGWLIDKSALVRIQESPDGRLWADRTDSGHGRVSTLTRLEIGYSARSAADLDLIRTTTPYGSLATECLTPVIERRAVAVQQALAAIGHHRAPSVPDLMIAATAELAGLTVLHRDKGFEIIARVTGQPVERLRMPDD